MNRRDLLSLAVAGVAVVAGPRAIASSARAKVVVVGGGYGGATAAKYLAHWGGDAIDVTLVEANAEFVSCPMSNLVLGGTRDIGDITRSYDGLARRGITIVRDSAIAVDADRRTVRLARGPSLPYDRLVLAPGIDFFFDRVEGLRDSAAQAKYPHAWKAGSQTVALRAQLAAMADGGVFAISIPTAPFRCPPGPYERACQVAAYFKRAKPRSKVLVLDANPDLTSKKALFTRAWRDLYGGIVEYRPDHVLTGIDTARSIAKFETADDVRADLLNIIPPHGAGAIARQAGAITANDQWCEVDFLTFESVKVSRVHVLGDAIQVAEMMPKSGHMANQHGKVCAAAIIALLSDRPVNATPTINNTCYSFLNETEAAHVASVHRYDASRGTLVPVAGAGGLSPAMSRLEGDYAWAWANNIWADMLT
jgi:NADPH-dependent 2,4-dienoyl-CoA reductase/sulfur reductase-like enzyme